MTLRPNSQNNVWYDVACLPLLCLWYGYDRSTRPSAKIYNLNVCWMPLLNRSTRSLFLKLLSRKNNDGRGISPYSGRFEIVCSSSSLVVVGSENLVVSKKQDKRSIIFWTFHLFMGQKGGPELVNFLFIYQKYGVSFWCYRPPGYDNPSFVEKLKKLDIYAILTLIGNKCPFSFVK
jgi:hypothetical protein